MGFLINNNINHFKTYLAIFIACVLMVNAYGQSDDPCGAPDLVPGATCVYQGGTNVGATNTSNIPAPGCASYSGSDVWYKSTVTANGTLTVDLTQGSMTDGGMAFYSATSCAGPFTLIECDDDDSPNGLMPRIGRSGLTPGQVIYIRIWKYAGGTGTFSICATSPEPPEPCNENSPLCANAIQLCTTLPIIYCNSSGGQNPPLGSYACLGSTPNPMWLQVNILTSGSMSFQISQTSNAGNLIDVDYAMYGPYPNSATACGSIGPSTPAISCSFSANAVETATIPNAQAGMTYMLLVTNYNGSAGQINFTPSPANTAVADCSTFTSCSASATMTPADCGQPNGSVTAIPETGTPPYTYSWNTPGNPTTQTVNNVPPGTYTVTVTSSPDATLAICQATATVTVTNNTATYSSTSTPASCAEISNGTATANFNMSGQTGITATYAWNDPAGQTTQTATGLANASYTCTVTLSNGCVGTTTVAVGLSPSMTSNFTNISNVTCNSGNDGVLTLSVSGGSTPYFFTWDNSASTTNTANDLFAGTHIVTVTDNNGCIISNTQNITEPAALLINNLTPDTQICPEDDIQLNVSGTGGSSAYTFTWFEGTTIIGTGNTITVDPNNSGTQYCVELTEACGSPKDAKCVTITFPTPIIPRLTPNQSEDCIVGEFEFENSSINKEEIASTYYDFGDNKSTIELNYDSTSHSYPNAGTYSIYMVVTSIYGCIYEDTLKNIVKVLPNPEAHFFFSDNPASVFETTILVYDKSTLDVVDWQWSSPGSIPDTSSLRNPVFTFPEGDEGTYEVTLIVTSNFGCKDTLTHILSILDDLLFFAPNSFTPNEDQFNQTWKLSLRGADISNFNIKIYNRWGEVIWESFDPNIGWDGTYNGKLLPAGQYVWKATMKNKKNDGKKEFNGNINLLK